MIRLRIAKKKPVDAPAKAPRFWLPAGVLLLAPLAIALLALRDPWYTNGAALILPDAFAAGTAALGLLALALFVSPRLRERAAAHAEAPAKAGTAAHRGWLFAAFLGASACAVLLKFGQYRSGQLPEDTAALANVAFNVWDHFGFETSVFGLPSYFAIHFMPIIALFAPVGRLGGAFGMLAFQAVVLSTAPFAVYALVRLKTGSASAALAAWVLALTSPLYFLAARASLAPQVCLPAFLLWAVYCAETRRWVWAAALTLLGALCTEQAPLVFAGAGLWAALRLPGRRAWGLAAVAASALLWRFEWRVIHSYPRPYDFWGAFFGYLGRTPREGLAYCLHSPFAFLKCLFWPVSTLTPLGKALGSTGLLALFSPWELIPFLVAFAPHWVAAPSTFYHNLDLHYAAYVMAPLYWAFALGAARAWLWLRARGQERFLLAWAFAVASLNLLFVPPLLMPARGPQLFWGFPEIMPKIPPGAKVWALEYAAPPLSFRKDLELIYGDGVIGKPGAPLFKPDYVLIDVTYLLEPYKAAQRARLSEFLAENDYGAVAATPTMYLLGRRQPPKEGAPLEPLAALPEPGPRGRLYEAQMQAALLAPLRQMQGGQLPLNNSAPPR